MVEVVAHGYDTQLTDVGGMEKVLKENSVKESGNEGVAMECNVAYNLIEYDDKNNGLVILDELFQKDGGSKELESSNNSTRLRSNPPLLSLKIVKASLNTPKRGVIHGGFIREILVSFEKVTGVRKELNLGFDFKLIELLLASCVKT
nr:hypothetical protein [Tanacetum cinerariifolium]